MIELPNNLDTIIEKSDRELQREEIPPHARPRYCVIKTAKALKIQRLPLEPLSENDPEKDCRADLITQRIYSWYQEFYGDRIRLDPSENSRIAIFVDGDMWEGELPLFLNGLVAPSRELNIGGTKDSAGIAFFNCSIPDDHISPRRSALFMAKSVLRDIRDGGQAC